VCWSGVVILTTSRSESRLPRTFVWGVWSVVALAFVVPWVAFSLLDIECRAPCDGPTYVFLGILQLAVLVLVVAKLVWLARARVRRELGRRRPPTDLSL